MSGDNKNLLLDAEEEGISEAPHSIELRPLPTLSDSNIIQVDNYQSSHIPTLPPPPSHSPYPPPPASNANSPNVGSSSTASGNLIDFNVPSTDQHPPLAPNTDVPPEQQQGGVNWNPLGWNLNPLGLNLNPLNLNLNPLNLHPIDALNLTNLRNLNLNPLDINFNPLNVNFNPLGLHVTDLQNLNPLNPVHRERMQHIFTNLQTGTQDMNQRLQRAVTRIRSNEYREKMSAVLTKIKNTKEYQSTSMTDYDVVFESVDMYTNLQQDVIMEKEAIEGGFHRRVHSWMKKEKISTLIFVPLLGALIGLMGLLCDLTLMGIEKGRQHVISATKYVYSSFILFVCWWRRLHFSCNTVKLGP